MNKSVALIAHDEKKQELADFSRTYADILQMYPLIATGTTGGVIREAAGLEVECMRSGPLGGDQQIGSMVSDGAVKAVFFFRDPLAAQPHEADVSALMRICDVYSTPLATNSGSALAVINWLKTEQANQQQIKLVEPLVAIR